MLPLVTGHKGYIGARLMQRIDANGMDLNDGNLVNVPLPDTELVYHLAAHASVSDSWRRPVDYMDNLRTTVRLVHAYPEAKVIFANTCASLDPESSPYAFSKKAAADYLRLFHQNAVVLVFPNIFGDSPRSVVDKFKGKDKVKIYGDGLQVRDYVHVDDIVGALVLAKDWEPGEYFLGSGIGTTVLELAGDREIEWLPAREEQREVTLENTTPSWKPTINVHDFLNS